MEKKTSKWGIACFVLAIIGFMTAFLGGFGVVLDFFAIICGIVACFRRKGKAWPQIAGFTIAAVSLISYFAFLSGLNALDNSLATSGSNITVTENTQPTNALPSATPLAEVTDKTYKVGDTIIDGSLNITIQSIEWYESENQFIEPSEGNRFIKVIVYAENTSDSNVENVSSWSFSAYADDEAVNETFLMSDDKSFSGEIGAGKKLTGSIFYEIPADTKVFEIQYASNVFSNHRVKFIQNLE